ncbi:response regulator [Bacillus sp. FJAT-44742]|uniref:response regulator n=1 Tax=Bacillus sp. FJAT-44742 TaxID=2014005 RepID=UPI001E52E64B|nr:response regulator [Bacillus sp. FJAT-44742]
MKTIEVVIIEDDETAAAIYAEFISKSHGFAVSFIANSAEQALEMLKIKKPDLILLDVFLPDMNGIECIWEIRKNYSGIDFILITASNETETVKEAIRGGAFSYIIKPVMMNRFLQTLEQYRSTFSRLSKEIEIEQNDIDNMFKYEAKQTESQSSNTKKASLPKGVDSLTLDRILKATQEFDDSFNADQLAKSAGVSHSTARRYLEYLISSKKVEVFMHYGQVGRPERKYKKTR